MWADGAGFETVVNQEMGEEFSYGMDPSLLNDENVIALGNVSANGSVGG